MDVVNTLLQKLTLDSTVEDSKVNAYWRGLVFPLTIGNTAKKLARASCPASLLMP